MTINNEQRKDFIAFLNRITLDQDISNEEWQNIVVTHYFDKNLEEVRCQFVRLWIESSNPNIWTERNKNKLLLWVNDLQNQ